MKQQIDNAFKAIEDDIHNVQLQSTKLAADSARRYYRKRFTDKKWEMPWKALKRPKSRGTLMVTSGALLNSIRIERITDDTAVITAGNSKVQYAQVHNEGYKGTQKVSAHRRRTRSGGSTTVRSHQRSVNIPKRQFMGFNQQLTDNIIKRIQRNMKNMIK